MFYVASSSYDTIHSSTYLYMQSYIFINSKLLLNLTHNVTFVYSNNFIVEMDPKTSKLIEGIVLPRVSAHWDTIAAFLEYPIPKTKEINVHCRGDPRQCCKMLLEDWFTTSNGVAPKTWEKLVEVLSEISDIAASTVQIKKSLREKGMII